MVIVGKRSKQDSVAGEELKMRLYVYFICMCIFYVKNVRGPISTRTGG